MLPQPVRLRLRLRWVIAACFLLRDFSCSEGLLEHGFWIDEDLFWKDGEPFQILGGEVHYFRIIPDYWEDRLLRAKALGLNTIQTYVAWNVHEPREKELHFEGNADLVSFVNLAQKLDLLVMLRIGPYMCAEWDLGGLPSWLLAQRPQLQLRSSDPAYLYLVDKWWDILLPIIVPLLYINGGPVIMVQVENEFGSYGRDMEYLKHLVHKVRAHLGKQIIIYTTDGGSESTLENGTLPGGGVFSAVDFPMDWDAAQAFAVQKKFNAEGKSPALVSEFYTGWLTHWQEKIATTNSEQTAAALQKILGMNASAVLYMAHGGTNFGFYSGANTGETATDYKPDITSYDYNAPIGEAGDTDNAKFTALRRVLASQYQVPLPEPPALPLRTAYGKLTLEKKASLLDVVELVSSSYGGIMTDEPYTMESLSQLSGFILYETQLPSYVKSGSILHIPVVHDRAQIFVWTKLQADTPEPCYIGTIERWSPKDISLPFKTSSPGLKLQILVENMGRVNYGPFLFDQKGIISSVFLDGRPVLDWRTYLISLDDFTTLKRAVNSPHYFPVTFSSNLSILPNSNLSCGSAVSATDVGFYFGALTIEDPEKPADTFLSMKGWRKGLAFINGFNLGRYWANVGPQCTLYIPSPLLHSGDNELIVFEIEQPQADLEVEFVYKHDFTCGITQTPYVGLSAILSHMDLACPKERTIEGRRKQEDSHIQFKSSLI